MDESTSPCSCGFDWTPADQLWSATAWLRPCDCKSHVDPADNERLQHHIGNHGYRAWSLSDAKRRTAELERARRQS